MFSVNTEPGVPYGLMSKLLAEKCSADRLITCFLCQVGRHAVSPTKSEATFG